MIDDLFKLMSDNAEALGLQVSEQRYPEAAASQPQRANKSTFVSSGVRPGPISEQEPFSAQETGKPKA